MTYILILFLTLINASFAAEDEVGPKKPLGVKKILRHIKSGKSEKIRIKDITSSGQVRANQLVGYGLVVGLNGSGDTLASSPQTKESIISMLERLGVNIREGKVPSGKNVAAVMVTASLPAFARHGTKIDVTVSAIGDAKDLRGGTLLVTPLLAADGEVYAVSQGPVSVSGVTAGGGNATKTKGVPTTGFISNGAIVEKEINFQLNNLKELNLSLINPDFTTAKRIAIKIDEFFNEDIADALDPGTVRLKIPKAFQRDIVSFLAEVEQLRIRPDQIAKIVVDDTNGVIVMGNNVRISPVALAHGSVTIQVVETPMVSQPNIVMPGIGPSVASAVSASIAASTSMAPKAPKPDLTEEQYKQQVQSLNDIFKAQDDALVAQIKSQKDTVDADPTLNRFEIQSRKEAIDAQGLNDKQELKEKQQLQLKQLAEQHLKATQRNILATGTLGASPARQTVVGLNGVRTEVVKKTDVEIKEETGKFGILDSGVSLEELVNALNALGVPPKDMSAILHAIKASGSMQAEIISR